MQEKVGDIILDYKYYKGEDLYSDGEVENRLLDIVTQKKDYNHAIQECDDFAVLYHLAKDREGIVQVMNISNKDIVLEIGSGCGAITGALARKAQEVDCIELSKMRSLINANKNSDCNNIVIHVGNFEDVAIEKKYNVITLIGVLEYAQYYINSVTPFDDMLQKVKKYMAEDAKLYIAIENRLGLKYLSGASEDHLGLEYEGVLNYPNSNKVRTFTKTELISMLKDNGFKDPYFYYPYPDYKFPRVIFSDEYAGSEEEMNIGYSNYGAPRVSSFDEKKVYESIVGTPEWKMLANSFIVEVERE